LATSCFKAAFSRRNAAISRRSPSINARSAGGGCIHSLTHIPAKAASEINRLQKLSAILLFFGLANRLRSYESF
jgi:hypothetical protein